MILVFSVNSFLEVIFRSPYFRRSYFRTIEGLGVECSFARACVLLSDPHAQCLVSGLGPGGPRPRVLVSSHVVSSDPSSSVTTLSYLLLEGLWSVSTVRNFDECPVDLLPTRPGTLYRPLQYHRNCSRQSYLVMTPPTPCLMSTLFNTTCPLSTYSVFTSSPGTPHLPPEVKFFTIFIALRLPPLGGLSFRLLRSFLFWLVILSKGVSTHPCFRPHRALIVLLLSPSTPGLHPLYCPRPPCLRHLKGRLPKMKESLFFWLPVPSQTLFPHFTRRRLSSHSFITVPLTHVDGRRDSHVHFKSQYLPFIRGSHTRSREKPV